MNVSVTFSSQLLSSRATQMTQVPIEINNNLQFSQIWCGETFKSLHNVVVGDILLPQIKILEKMNVFLFLIQMLI